MKHTYHTSKTRPNYSPFILEEEGRSASDPYYHKKQAALLRKRQREEKEHSPEQQLHHQEQHQHQHQHQHQQKRSLLSTPPAVKIPIPKPHRPPSTLPLPPPLKKSPLPTFPCLYTHQKLKKKKSWQDGEIRVNVGQGRITLYSLDEGNASLKSVLESKYCLQDEMNRIASKDAEYIEFEKHLVEVDFAIPSEITTGTISALPHCHVGSTQSSGSGSGSGQSKLVAAPVKRVTYKSFKVPSRVEVPALTTAHGGAGLRGEDVEKNTGSVNSGGHYAIADDELDDIWNNTHPHTADDDDPSDNRGSDDGNNYGHDCNISSEVVFPHNSHSPNRQDFQLDDRHHHDTYIELQQPITDDDAPCDVAGVGEGRCDNQMEEVSNATIRTTSPVKADVPAAPEVGLWGESVWTAGADETSNLNATDSGADAAGGGATGTAAEKDIFAF